MHVEITCTGELAATKYYDELIADYNLHQATGSIGMKAAYLLSEASRKNYINLEAIGALTIFRAMHANKMIGIISVITVSVVPMIESLYVLNAYRKTGAGDALYGAAKAYCKAQGKVGVIMGVPPGTVMDKRLTRSQQAVISKLFYIEL